MTLGQFEYRYSDKSPVEAVLCQLPNMCAEDASRKAWERSLAEAASKRRERRRNRWKVDRCPEPSDLDSEVETLEALGYDVEKIYPRP